MEDVTVRVEGNIVQFFLNSQAAEDWVDENVESEGWQWMGNALCVDIRYASGLSAGMANAGLTVGVW